MSELKGAGILRLEKHLLFCCKPSYECPNAGELAEKGNSSVRANSPEKVTHQCYECPKAAELAEKVTHRYYECPKAGELAEKGRSSVL